MQNQTQTNKTEGPPNEPPEKWSKEFEGSYRSKWTKSHVSSNTNENPDQLISSESNNGDKPSSEDHVPLAAEALRYAHDIRKFEIDLYWKRSVYFQTVLGIILGALALTLKTNDVSAAKPVWIINLSILQGAIAYLGTVLAFAWYAATRGGKYWQRNWETHVDVLENKVTGPLYKTVYSNALGPQFTKFLNEYPYSTSKLNSFVALIFLALFIFTQIIFLCSISGELLSSSRMPFLIALIFSVLTMLAMHFWTKFEIATENSPHNIDTKPQRRVFK